MSGAKVFIGIKTRGRIIAHLFTWLGNTMRYVVGPDAKSGEISSIIVYNSIGKPEDANQNNVFQEFLKTDCTHLLCLDDDIMCDMHLLERLVKYDLDIVASPVLIMGEKGVTYFASNFNPEDETYSTVDIFPPNNKLQECDVVGFGAILIKREVIEQIPDPKYETIWTEKGFMKVPPDNNFCFKAKKLGYKVHVDGTMMIGQMCETNLMYSLQGYPNFVPPVEEINKSRKMSQFLQQNTNTVTLRPDDFKTENPILKKVFGSGIVIQQIPSELEGLLHYLGPNKPKVYLEIGTLAGGTCFVFSEFMDAGGRIISIDKKPLNPIPHELRTSLLNKNHDCNFITGDSTDDTVLDEVQRILNGFKVDLLFIDGNHYFAEKDFQKYSPLVRRGGLVVFHDIHKTVTGPESNTGTVPEVWKHLKRFWISKEFVAGNPEGYGIGVLHV